MLRSNPKTFGLLMLGQLLCLNGLLAAENDGSMAELEAKLLNAGQVILGFEISATGSVEAELEGTLALRGKEGIELAVTGSFGGEELDLILQNSDSQLLFGPADSPSAIEMPAAMREAVIIGLTRMGLLHNIVRLAGGSAPDHSDGGVAEWVTAQSVAKSADARRITFDIVVDGEPSGSAALRLDPFGMMVKRDQTVAFPQGDMVVVENYFNLQVSF